MSDDNLPPGVRPCDIPPTDDDAAFDNFVEDFINRIIEDEGGDSDSILDRWDSQPGLVDIADKVIDWYNLTHAEFKEKYDSYLANNQLCNEVRKALAAAGHPRVDSSGNIRTVYAKCPDCKSIVQLPVVRCELFLDKNHKEITSEKCPNCFAWIVVLKTGIVIIGGDPE